MMRVCKYSPRVAVAVASALILCPGARTWAIGSGAPGGSYGGGTTVTGAGASAGSHAGGAVTSAPTTTRSSASAARTATSGPVGRSPVAARDQNSGNAGAGYAAPANVGGSNPMLRARNSWTTDPNATSGRIAARPIYRNGTDPSDRRPAGTYLNPGAYGANLTDPAGNGWTDRSGNGGMSRGRGSYPRIRGRFYYDPYVYGPAYAPFIGYGNGDYAYNGDDAGDPVGTAPANVGNQPVPQVSGPTVNPEASQQPAPAAQDQRQGPNTGNVPNNGPDSLVEAVQTELVRRGYLGGKVDAMFNPETKEALRRFQTDHNLATSGLINEATLHALQLD